MTIDEESKLMAEHGITSEEKTVYLYKGYQYGTLQDALNYATKSAERAQKSASS
jgi:hypothetical protein